MTFSIRCSRLPLIVACPQAAKAPGIDLDAAGAPARLGSACHAALSDRIERCFDFADLDDIAERFGVELDNLRPLVGTTFKLWDKVKHYFPNPMVEQPLSLIDADRYAVLTGHADVLSWVESDEEIRILDLKTGWLEGDPRHQLRGYGRLALEGLPAKRVYACQLRPRDGTLEGWRWTRQELLTWWDNLAEEMGGEPKFRPGRHCSHCPRWAECPAAKQYTRGVMEHLVALDYGGADKLSAAQALDLHAMVKHAEALAERGRDVLRACVESAGGELWHEEHGLVLSQQKRARILFDAGENILRAALKGRLGEAVNVSKTAMEKIVREGAGRGMKGRAAEMVMASLKDVGAVTYEPFERLEAKRRQFKQEGNQFVPVETESEV